MNPKELTDTECRVALMALTTRTVKTGLWLRLSIKELRAQLFKACAATLACRDIRQSEQLARAE